MSDPRVAGVGRGEEPRTRGETGGSRSPVRRRRHRRRRRYVLPVVGVLALAVVLSALWLAWRASVVQRELTDTREQAVAAEKALKASEWRQLQEHAYRMSVHSSHARYAASDPLWAAASHLPVLGRNFSAVTTVADAMDYVAQSAVSPLAQSRTITTVKRADRSVGDILVSLGEDKDVIVDAAKVIAVSQRAVEGIDRSGLLGPVDRGVGETADKLGELRSLTRDAAAAAGALPSLLGAQNPSTLLLVFQNPGEARATGGLLGAWGELTATRGRMSLTEFGANDDLPTLTALPEGVNPQLTALFGEDILLSQNANLSASWPDAAKLVSTMWTKGPGRGRTPDAVISIDPVALGQLLKITGPVRASDGTEVTSGNAADVLLRRVYFRFDEKDQARRLAFLGSVTKAVFAGLTASSASPLELGKTLTRLADDRRIMVWGQDSEAQNAWQSLDVSGDLGAPQDASRLTFALNNAEASKLQAYLATSVTRSCAVNGSQTVTAALKSTVPAKLPDYMLSHVPGLDRRTMRMVSSWYVSPRQRIGTMTVDGRPVSYAVNEERGWTVLRVTVEVKPGQTVPIAVTMSAPAGGSRVGVTDIRVAPQVAAVPVTSTGC